MVTVTKGEGGEKSEKAEKVQKETDPRTEEAKHQEEILLKKRPTLDGLKLTLFLIEKTEGLLNHRNFEISFGPGGGSIDLKDYLSAEKNGTFYLRVRYDQDMDPKLTRVYFLSQTKSECNKYFEITNFWNKSMKDEGLNLNTVKERHLALVAGTFFFASPFQGKLRLGHLNIKDSRHPDLLCKSKGI
jgi:hypothetical protein